MCDTKFYICRHCGNIVEMLQSAGVPVVCCGEKMEQLIPGTVEGSREKHIPVVTVDGDIVKVAVGSVAHPMTEAHSIQWIQLVTEHGSQRKCLNPGDAPELSFALNGDKALEVYAYCNLHGLWKTVL